MVNPEYAMGKDCSNAVRFVAFLTVCLGWIAAPTSVSLEAPAFFFIYGLWLAESSCAEMDAFTLWLRFNSMSFSSLKG